jgi:hypothetical protein
VKLDPTQTYTFSRYFESGYYAEDLAEALGYSLAYASFNLPEYTGELDRLVELRERIEEALPYVDLTTELARREVIISRIVLELIHYTKAKLRIEFTLKVNNQLQGTLDYLIRNAKRNQLLVIEAKQADLNRGFTQLLAEMVALDLWEDSPTVPEQGMLIGAVTTGKIWQFATLDRENKSFRLGINSYRVVEDIEELMRILVKTLS